MGKFVQIDDSLTKLGLKFRYIIGKNVSVEKNNLLDSLKQTITKVEGKLKMSILKGTELFIPLGLNFTTKVPKDGYAFSDDNDVLCLFESRQAEKTKITLETTTFITYLQGNAQTSDEYLNQATLSLLNSYKQFCKGTFILDFDYENMMMETASGG